MTERTELEQIIRYWNILWTSIAGLLNIIVIIASFYLFWTGDANLNHFSTFSAGLTFGILPLALSGLLTIAIWWIHDEILDTKEQEDE